jgi:hypothetical protein
MRAMLVTFVVALALRPFPAVATEVSWTSADELAPVGNICGLAICDLDDDGDNDVCAASMEPGDVYWNVGTPQVPSWELDSTQFPSLLECDPSGRYCDFGDLDADGDLDMVFGCWEGDLHAYWNVGTPQSPAWEIDPAMFEGVLVDYKPAPRLADLDGDGDLDLLVAADTSIRQVRYFENTGSPVSPEWTDRGTLEGVTFPIEHHKTISVGDLDGDGDLDIVGLCGASEVLCWENVGTAQSFEFVGNPAMLSGVDTHPLEWVWEVDAGDLDGDGAPDLLVYAGTTGFHNYLYLNEGITSVEQTTWGAIKALYR